MSTASHILASDTMDDIAAADRWDSHTVLESAAAHGCKFEAEAPGWELANLTIAEELDAMPSIAVEKMQDYLSEDEGRPKPPTPTCSGKPGYCQEKKKKNRQ